MIRFVEFRAMNTDILLAAEGERSIDGMQAAKTFIDESEQRFSRFLPGSELTQLNRSAGDWLPVSSDLFEMLELSLAYYTETRGLFDPSILADLKQLGYDRSMDEIRRNGALPVSRLSQKSRLAFTEIELDPAEKRVRLPHGMELDLGGIAKSWIVDQTARLLSSYAEACGVSAGGDILFVGRPQDGSDWNVFLEDPRDSLKMICELRLGPGAVATSSVMKRSWLQGREVRHHLIDPRTGEPVKTDWLSVTALAPDIITADIYAKTILIGGEGELQRILEAKPEITFIAVNPDGSLLGSPDYRYHIENTTFARKSLDIAL